MMISVKLRCAVCVLSVLLAGRAVQGMEHRFRYYTDTDGLSSNTIHCFYQDEKGYIWVGTSDGLDRFNSHDFTNYRSDHRQHYSIRNNCVYSICGESVAGGDRIWVGTSDGVYIFDTQTERFEQLPIESDGEVVRNLLVYTLASDTGGNVWIGTLGEGLFRYNVRNGVLEQYTAEKYPEALASNVIAKVLLDHDNNIWVAAGGGASISKYNPENNRFSSFRIEDPLRHASIGRISTMCQDSFGDIWIAGFSGELYKFEIPRFTFTQNYPPPGAGYGRVRALIEYAPGILMLGTDNGLVNFNTKDRSFEPLDSGTTGRNGRLNDKFIHAILKDREGGVWIGTYFGGINYLSPLSSLFTSIGPGPGCGRIISKFCEGPDGKIWIGSDDGGLSLFDPRTGSYTPVTVDPRRPGLNIHALTLDDDCLWVGTYGDGLYRMDLRSGAVRHFDQSAGGSDKLDTYSVFRDSHGSLWVGTKQGICRYDDALDQIVLVAALGHNSDVVDICEDGLGNVWFATQGRGLIRYRHDKGEFTNLSREGKPGLSDFVSSLAIENDRLWIGTLGSGLCRYDIRQDSLVRSFDDTAYGNCAVYQVIQSGSDLWLTTNKGVLKYSPAAERMQINKYTAEDGLLANIFNAHSGIKASTGHIYIGCNNGVNRFYPYDFIRRENSTKLGIVFPDFKLFNRSVPVDGELLTETIDCQRKITVRGRRISFSIDFIALNFSSPLRTTYRYKLENFDEKWLTTQLDESRGVQHVSYTNLPPNRYRFVVSAAAGAELPGEPAVLEITVLPPWWMSRTMLGVYALLGVLAVAGGGHYLRRRLGRVHNEQIASITRKNKLDLLEAKVNLFTEVAAEIRTPVSLISAPAEQIAACAELPGSVLKDVAIIRKNCDRLLHLVNQILGLRNSEKTAAPVIEYGIDACELLASAVAEIRNGCPRPDIELDLLLPQTTFRVDICPDHLTRMVSNVVDNAFRFAENRIDVVLEAPVLDGDNSIFVIRVRDDGAGIRNEDREKIFNLFYTSDSGAKGSGKRLGIGLTIVRNLALKMGAELTVCSEVGQWTEFAMKFPVAAPGGGQEAEPTVESQTVCLDASKSREENSGCRPVVMLVEQHADFADFFVRHLSGRFTIICVAEAAEALELLHTRPVAAVVCETDLVGMDGIAFCAAVKRDRALDHIPLVLVSVDESAGGKVRGLQAGADVYLEKPVSVGVLEAQILSLVENRAGLRAKYSKMPYFQLDEPAAKSSGNRFMSEVNQYVMDNISNSALTVDDVAAALNVGRTVFFNRIKSLTGMTPNEFLRSARLRSAAELLAAPNNLRVTEICYMVGFASASYFAKCFAAQFGMLPTEYLEKYRKG